MTRYKGSVLIVDDEEPMRRVLSRRLEAECYFCVTAADGRDALEKAATQQFDIVILDILMPGMSGMDVLPKLATWQPDVQVIMVTSVADIDTIAEAMRLGACDYVTKPFNMGDLVARVDRALRKKTAKSDSAEKRTTLNG